MLPSFAVLEMVDTTFGISAAGADTANLVSMVDRTQAAQLYAGEEKGIGYGMLRPESFEHLFRILNNTILISSGSQLSTRIIYQMFCITPDW